MDPKGDPQDTSRSASEQDINLKIGHFSSIFPLKHIGKYQVSCGEPKNKPTINGGGLYMFIPQIFMVILGMAYD